MEEDEAGLRERRVDVNLKILDGGLRALIVLTVVGGEIVLLFTHPALFFLNSLALPGLAYRWWKERKRAPDELGGGP